MKAPASRNQPTQVLLPLIEPIQHHTSDIHAQKSSRHCSAWQARPIRTCSSRHI